MFQSQIKSEKSNFHRTRGKLSYKICYDHERPFAYPIEYEDCPNCPAKTNPKNPIGI
jgi:hypothetical protein